MNGRGEFLIGEGGEQVRMGHHARALSGIERHLHKIIVRVGLHAIESGQAVVQIQVIAQQQRAVIRRSIPHRILQEQIQRRAQVGDDFGSESGIKFSVLGEVFQVIHLQPVMEEILHLGSRARIGQHAAGLPGDLLRGVEGSLSSQLPQIGVRQ